MPKFEVGGLKRFDPNKPTDVVSPIQERGSQLVTGVGRLFTTPPSEAQRIQEGGRGPQPGTPGALLRSFGVNLIDLANQQGQFAPQPRVGASTPTAAQLAQQQSEQQLLQSKVTEAWRADP